jgi:hypothetical protein
MKATATMVTRWVGAANRRRLACSVAALAFLPVLAVLAGLAGLGCNKSRHDYPTISQRHPDGGNIHVTGT